MILAYCRKLRIKLAGHIIGDVHRLKLQQFYDDGKKSCSAHLGIIWTAAEETQLTVKKPKVRYSLNYIVFHRFLHNVNCTEMCNVSVIRLKMAENLQVRQTCVKINCIFKVSENENMNIDPPLN